MKYPYEPQPSQKKYYVPKTLAADFTEFLRNDIPHTVMDFVLHKNWYDQSNENYEPNIIRGMIYSAVTKSHYANTDNNVNFRADVNSGIEKGDIIVSEDGKTYILDTEITLQSNNAPARALVCNINLVVERYHQEITDDDGYLVEPEGYRPIIDPIPVNIYRYDGRPEYNGMSNTPGTSPNALIVLTVQYNEQTKNIRIDDEFTYGNIRYVLVDIDNFSANEVTGRGCLKMQAKKVAGGIL